MRCLNLVTREEIEDNQNEINELTDDIFSREHMRPFENSVGSFPRELVRAFVTELLVQEDLYDELSDKYNAATATGSDLDKICEEDYIFRLAATEATGTVKIYGIPGTIIQKGYQVTSKNNIYNIEETKEIPANGAVGTTTVGIKCTEAGTVGNVAINEINSFAVSYRGLEKVENLEKKILEYKLFKEISQLFTEKENEYNVSHLRMGNQNFGEKTVEYDISSLTLENLIASFKNILNSKNMKKNVQENIKLNLEEEYTTKEAHFEITESIKNEKKVLFSHLLKNKFSKIRIVTMFLCILDMFKNGEIDIIIDQNSFFVTKIM